MKTFVVSTSNENHFLNSLNEAKEDMQWGINTMKKLQIKDTIHLYRIPAKTDEDLSDQEHFIKCLENDTAIHIEKQEVK